jgi:phytoene dehydrogenase-like protein
MTAPNSDRSSIYDAVVIGSGFGGIGATLSLAESGARVVMCETLSYPGGCASSFTRNGYTFDSGATLVSGLDESQLFGRWIKQYNVAVQCERMDPLLELHAPNLHLTIPRRREALLEQLCAIEHAPVQALQRFFKTQRRVANIMWALLDEPHRLPPLTLRQIPGHLWRVPGYCSLLPYVGRSMGTVLSRFGLDNFAPLVTYLDALCQITVQCASAVAEAPLAFAAMDYYYRGSAHLAGGVGTLAQGLSDAAAQLGAEIQFSNRVKNVTRNTDGTWQVTTRRGTFKTRHVIANLHPGALPALLGESYREPARLAKLRSSLATGYSAAMLYLVVRPPDDASEAAHHIELIADPSEAFINGNHIFVSISGAHETQRAPVGHRTLTISTHIPLATLHNPATDVAAYTAKVQQNMRDTFAAGAPQWAAAIVHELTGSARTFQRFVGRPGGAVGGAPRIAGLQNYRGMSPLQAAPNLWLVGDSAFPGQSALAAAISGIRVAGRIAKNL